MAQAGHAFVSAIEQARAASQEQVDQYLRNEQPKIVLRAKNEAVIRRAAVECEQAGIPFYLVIDAGRTVFNEPTVTCLGIGPVVKGDLPKFVQRLQLLTDLA